MLKATYGKRMSRWFESHFGLRPLQFICVIGFACAISFGLHWIAGDENVLAKATLPNSKATINRPEGPKGASIQQRPLFDTEK
jgi:hypothetical protein